MREWVYVHIAECGTVLYVGRTTEPERRQAAHRSHAKRAIPGQQRRSRWWPVVHRIEWIECSDTPGWLVEERTIARLNPVFNRSQRGLEHYHATRRKRAIDAGRVAQLTDRDVALVARLARRSPGHFDDVFSALQTVGGAS